MPAQLWLETVYAPDDEPNTFRQVRFTVWDEHEAIASFATDDYDGNPQAAYQAARDYCARHGDPNPHETASDLYPDNQPPRR